MRQLARHKNRRLYDMSTSTYVTLDQLLEMARAEEVSVKEQETGRDLTSYTLALAIARAEDLQPSPGLASRLMEIIRVMVQPK